ncbi:MAG: prolyl oligopeptidase family serine peptidase [Verrucomicrobiaceae bacterium]|nr:prolyl oligopeptidase family serine peptidase [Verrucomicrobiaceae bacterium]
MDVNPASTIQVLTALNDADKEFDLLFEPGANHGVGKRKAVGKTSPCAIY